MTHVPELAERAGLQDIDYCPWVTDGRTDAGYWMRREHVSRARHRNQIGLNPRNAIAAEVFDVDHPHALEHLAGLAHDGIIPWGNVSVERLESGHAHVAYTYARPVHLNVLSRHKPIRLAARFAEWLAQTIGADAGYNGLAMHNPLVDQPGFRTVWHHAQPLNLGDAVREYIPKGWRKPKQLGVRTESGRNCELYEGALAWAALQDHDGIPVLDGWLTAHNAMYWDHPKGPLGYRELAGIARSVERTRDRWRVQGWGWHKPGWIEKRIRGGIHSGVSRRAAVADRDRQILTLWLTGYPQRAVADVIGCSLGSVQHAIRRAGDAGPRVERVRDPGFSESVRLLQDDGFTERQIAVQLAVSHGAVQRELRKAAARGTLTLQARGPRTDPEFDRDVVTLHDAGLSNRAIAAELQCSRDRVALALKRGAAGIESVLTHELPKIGMGQGVDPRSADPADRDVDLSLHTESVPEVGLAAQNHPPNVDPANPSHEPAGMQPDPQRDPDPSGRTQGPQTDPQDDPELQGLVLAAARNRMRVWDASAVQTLSVATADRDGDPEPAGVQDDAPADPQTRTIRPSNFLPDPAPGPAGDES